MKEMGWDWIGLDWIGLDGQLHQERAQYSHNGIITKDAERKGESEIAYIGGY